MRRILFQSLSLGACVSIHHPTPTDIMADGLYTMRHLLFFSVFILFPFFFLFNSCASHHRNKFIKKNNNKITKKSMGDGWLHHQQPPNPWRWTFSSPKTDRLHLFRVITNITESFFFLFISTWYSGYCLVQPNSLPARNNEMSISFFSFVSPPPLLRRIIRLFQFQMSSIKQLKDPPNRWARTTLKTRRLYYLLVWY